MASVSATKLEKHLKSRGDDKKFWKLLSSSNLYILLKPTKNAEASLPVCEYFSCLPDDFDDWKDEEIIPIFTKKKHIGEIPDGYLPYQVRGDILLPRLEIWAWQSECSIALNPWNSDGTTFVFDDTDLRNALYPGCQQKYLSKRSPDYIYDDEEDWYATDEDEDEENDEILIENEVTH